MPSVVRVLATAALAAVAVTTSIAGTAATPSTRATAATPAVRALTAGPVGGPRLASARVVVDAPPGTPAPPHLKDAAWVLADLDSGQIIAAKAAHTRFRPASTLKVLTAQTLLPLLDPATVVRATADDANVEGSRVGVAPRGTYTVDQLFQGLLLASGNDAASALARAAGGLETTVAAMNASAAHLGALDTVAKNPSGLDAPGQLSSAYDLALIGRAAMEQPRFRTYVATRQAPFPGTTVKGKRQSFMIQNHNRLLYNYEGTIGLKNGYTDAARRTYISAVTRAGRTYLLAEMYSLEWSWRPQAAMYDWAFGHGDEVTPVGQLVDPGTVTAPSQPPATGAAAAAATGGGRGDAQPAGRAAVLASSRVSTRTSYAWPVVALAALLGVVVLRRRAVVARRRRARRTHPRGEPLDR